MTRYQEFLSPHGLHHVIECVWVLTPADSPRPVTEDRIFPDGFSDIVVSGCSAEAFGPAREVRLTSGHTTRVGFRIRNGVAKNVLGVPPADFAADPVSFGTLWGRRGRAYERSLVENSTPAVLATSLARFLSEVVDHGVDPDHAVLEAIHRLDRSLDANLCDLAHEVGVSERHLRRRFERRVGLGIKHYARINRFQRLLDAIRGHKRCAGIAPPGWAGLACDQGFADQAHLIREVKQFAGLNPSELLLIV